jgi:PHD/YefM family antitoxin component YafN of YafNO toxin-antitoxin module
MSVGYKKDEIVSASSVARSFGRILANIVDHKKQRMVVAKNNHLEAVILPIDEYEKLSELAELVEHIEIHELIVQRKAKDTRKRISLDTLLKEEGIAL